MTRVQRSLIRVAGVIAFGCGLASCGGGGHTLPAPLTASSSSAAAPGTVSSTRGSASFSITIPAATTASVRRAQYLSSSTAAVRIDVQQSGTEVSGFPVKLAVTPGSPNCTTTAGATSCTLSINVLPGTYSASITALDVNGNAISTAVAVPLAIVPGMVTNVPLTLNGVVASIAVTPSAANAGFVSGSNAAGYALVGQGPRSFTISATDTNGNTIVGAGTPALTVSSTGPVALTIGQPTSSAPNTFTLAPPSVWTAGSDQVTVTVTYPDGTPCSATGGACSASIGVAMRQVVLVNDNTLGTALTLYAEGDTAPLATITQGIFAPSPVWWSPSGDIISGNNGNLTVYAFPYQSAPYARLVTSSNSTNAIVWTAEVDPSGNLLVTDFFGSAIRVYAPPFVTPASGPSTATTTITDGLAYPGAFVIDRHGNMFAGNGNGGNGNYVTEYAAKTFAKIATITPPFTLPTGFCCVTVAAAPNGELAISSSQEPTVWIYDPPYTGAPRAALATGSNFGLGFDANSDLLVSNSAGGLVYAPPYTGPPTVFAPTGSISSCTIDDPGTIYCMQAGGTELDLYAKPYSTTPTQRVTTGINSTSAPQIVP